MATKLAPNPNPIIIKGILSILLITFSLVVWKEKNDKIIKNNKLILDNYYIITLI